MRKHKWLRRLGYLVAFVIVLYLVFWAALFNPLEGSVDRLEDLVPETVSFALHSSWGSLRSSDLFDRHVLESPVMDDIEASADLETRLYKPLRQIEEQINASVPEFLGKFSVLEDVAGREFLLAGNLTGPGEDLAEKLLNSPFVALTRISYKSRFMDVLKYGFVRNQIPNLKAYRDIYEYEIGEEFLAPGAPESAKYRYFRRIKDVLVVSNDRQLMEQTVKFGLAGGAAGSTDENLPRHYYFYYDLNQMPQDPGATLWVMLSQADRELGFALGGGGRSRGEPAEYLRAFFPVGLVRSLSLQLGVKGKDEIPLRGTVRMLKKDDFPDHIYELHYGGGDDVGKLEEELKPWAGMIPEGRAHVFTWMMMSPRDFLLSMFSALDESTQALLFEESASGDGWNEQRLAGDLGDWFVPGIALVQTRLPEADDIDLDSFDGGVPEPLPASSFFATLKPQLTPEGLVEYFKRTHERLGLKAPEEIESATGRLFRMPLKLKDRSLGLIDPGFALVRRKFVFSSNVGELKRMLEVEAGQGKSLLQSGKFQAALERSHAKANMFLFVDGDRLRPFLRDMRYSYALNASEYKPVEYRKNVILELNRKHRDWKTPKLNAEADRRMEERERRRQEVDFPEAIQEYRNLLFRAEPFGWLGVSLSLAADTASNKLDLRGALMLREVEDQ